MKKWRTLTIGLLICAHAAFATPKEIDRIIGIVNNGVILDSDIKNLLQSVKRNAQQNSQRWPGSDSDLLRRKIIDRLIMDNIQLQIAEKMGIVISNKDVDSAIANIAAQQNIDLNTLRRHLSYIGVDYNTYRLQIRKEIKIAVMRNNEVRRRITILPQELNSLTKQISAQNTKQTEVNVSHILLPLPENPPQNQAQTTEYLTKKIMNELKNGADFSKIITIYADDLKLLRDEKIGWSKLQDIQPLFAEHLVSTKKGDLVGPIRSNIGFHILKVNDIRSTSQVLPVTEVHARHIFLKPSVVMTDTQAHFNLEKVAQNIKNGRTNFIDEAKRISQDSYSALQGGDIGWSSLDLYNTAFRDVLIKLKKGEISAPTRSDFGWHLIQLLDTRQVDKIDTEQKNQAYNILLTRKFAEETKIWMQEIRAQTYVKIFNNHV